MGKLLSQHGHLLGASDVVQLLRVEGCHDGGWPGPPRPGLQLHLDSLPRLDLAEAAAQRARRAGGLGRKHAAGQLGLQRVGQGHEDAAGAVGARGLRYHSNILKMRTTVCMISYEMEMAF